MAGASVAGLKEDTSRVHREAQQHLQEPLGLSLVAARRRPWLRVMPSEQIPSKD